MAKIHKIAVVIPKYGLVGGAEQFASELTGRIARNSKYDIHVFANKWNILSDRITFHKVPIVSFPKFLTTVSFAYFAKKKIEQIGFDLIHSHDRVFKADIFTMHGIPHRIWVEEVRRKRHMSLFDKATQCVEKSLIDSECKKFISLSAIAKDTFLRQYHVKNSKLRIIHPGVDLDIFAKLDRTECRKEIRGKFMVPMQDYLILFVSMNFEIKGLDFLLKALTKIKTQGSNSNFKLLIVGKGNKNKYQKLAEQLGIAENIMFAGVVDKASLYKIYLASDIFSILSKFDTFGMVVLEAMAASVPVIVSNSVGAKDLVTQGENGFIVQDIANAETIAGYLTCMMDNKVMGKMGNEALKTAQEYSWDKVTGRMLNIYEEVLAEKHL
jgi:UDP-glucose:(heptosyl)LPS alpha-1,3-glucosyltransferase